MKHSWQILTILMAITIVVMAFNLTSEVQKESVDRGKVVLNSILSRSSVREYTSETVSQETIEQILKAGMSAPTAGNRQPWRFYVVRDTTIIRQLPSITKFADPMAQNANIVIVACGVPSESFPLEPRYWVQDLSAATENILLATHSLGLGAVWSGVYPGEERVATLRNLLDIPHELIPFNIIFLGHTDAEPMVKDKWKPENIHYYKESTNKSSNKSIKTETVMKKEKTIDHINMAVPNLEKSIKWYCDNLGFKIKGHFKNGATEIYYIDNGSITYELVENPSLNEPVVAHIAYVSDNIEQDHKLYSEAGVNPGEIKHLDWIWDNGVEYFFIEGAGGEKIELIHIR